MSDRVDQLFGQFKAAFAVGEEADPRALVDQLEGAEREELVVLIDAYLTRAPRQEWDEQAYRESAAPELVDALTRGLRGQAGTWPSLLPRLRERARLLRSDLVAQLADRLGVGDQEEKVAGYYHQMEQGTLPAAGVSDRVLDALGAIVGEARSTLREAGEAFGPGPSEWGGTAAVHARQGAPAEPLEGGALGSAIDEDPSDEVDRLFRGG